MRKQPFRMRVQRGDEVGLVTCFVSTSAGLIVPRIQLTRVSSPRSLLARNVCIALCRRFAQLFLSLAKTSKTVLK